MKDIFALTLDENSGEERLPGFSVEFPYLHSRAFLNRYVVPWHWHPALGLFYVESGAMEYEVPGGAIRLPAGAGGLVRGGVLHASHPLEENTVQQLRLFDARLGWGVAGVGWATLICQGAACVPAFIPAMRRLRKLPDAGAHPLVTRASLKDFLSVAVPGALQQGIVAAANIAIQGVVNGYGAAVAAGYSASVKMTNLVTSCFSTIGSGVTNFTAQNLGADKPERTRAGFRAAVQLVWLVALGFGLLYELLPDRLVGLFLGGGIAGRRELSARHGAVLHDSRLQNDLRRVPVRVQPDEAGGVQHRAGSVAARRRGRSALRGLCRAHRRVVCLAGRLEHRRVRRRLSPPPHAEKRIRKTALSQKPCFRPSAALFAYPLIPDSRTSPKRARTERCPPRSPARYSP